MFLLTMVNSICLPANIHADLLIGFKLVRATVSQSIGFLANITFFRLVGVPACLFHHTDVKFHFDQNKERTSPRYTWNALCRRAHEPDSARLTWCPQLMPDAVHDGRQSCARVVGLSGRNVRLVA